MKDQRKELPPVKTYAGGKPNYCTPVDAVNMSQECVDETAKRDHSSWVGLKGDEISECWKTGDVVAAVEAKLKEKNT